jgi:polyisoprenyl-phosphate glycosyltransferase
MKQFRNSVLSLIVPMFNESAALPRLFADLALVLDGIGINYEIICIDDGSTDDTLERLREKTAQDPRVKVVAFSRNFGKEAAMTAGLDHASGDAVIPMDADLQDPPELIPQMLELWQQGNQVVYARRASRAHDSVFKRKSARLFYSFFNKLSEMPIPHDVGDFRLLDRRVVDVIRRLPEKDRFMKGLFCWPGFKATSIEYERPARADGASKFGLLRLLGFALGGIASFSSVPIRAGMALGLLIALVAFVFAFSIIFKTLVRGVDVPGYASIMVTVLFLGGVQLFFTGLIGEYVGHIYREVKNRPLYVVAETIGL